MLAANSSVGQIHSLSQISESALAVVPAHYRVYFDGTQGEVIHSQPPDSGVHVG